MSRLRLTSLLFACAALLAMALPGPAQAAFGLNEFDVTFAKEDGTDATQAGSHPFEMTTSFGINYSEGSGGTHPDGELKKLAIEQIAGLVADSAAVPRCSTAEFLAFGTGTGNQCSDDAAVGKVAAAIGSPGGIEQAAVYNLVPPPGAVLRLGFTILRVPVLVDAGLKQSPEYNGVASLHNIRQTLEVFGSELTLWGIPADDAHDEERGDCMEGFVSDCPTDVEEQPFLTLPSSCLGPELTFYEALSWKGEEDEDGALTHNSAGEPQGFEGCGKLGFEPSISSQPSSDSAESASGLSFELEFDQQGLTSTTGLAQSTMEAIEVTLPPGVTANPSIAEGLGVCSEADLDKEQIGSAPGEGCPNSSKIGTLEVETPLLEEPVSGSVYIAEPDDPATAAPENPFDSLIAFYIVLKHPGLGILVKLPAVVEPDPETGQLITAMEDLPQLPFSRATFRFREGQRAPLITPPTCGTYTTEALLYPWADLESAVEVSSSFLITRGIGGGPCPSGGIPPFSPGFSAGSANNSAGKYSPFLMRLTRADGQRDMTRFGATLPPGVTGKLAGVDKCPDAQVALARAKTGKAELASPSCPANSKIGRTIGGAGVGGALTYVPGSLYLAGPYNGAPLSVVAITPALAGPFDAGTVVVRVALRIDPVTAEVRVDPGASDRLPHILNGIPLKVRDLQVFADRPDFSLNPTSCDPSAAKATIWGSFLDPFGATSPEISVDLQDRYQAADCARLGFKPRLALTLKGGTRRGGHPALRGVLRPRPGDANIAEAVVTLPRSAFLDQAHIRTICTRVQFAADNCPPGAVYGHASAHTPLLDDPLEGPVYLRSSNHKLPDLVLALHGLVDVTVIGRIDSHKGGIRTSFETAPDAPVSEFVLNMQGGKRGLIVNSRNICARVNRARTSFTGHNAKQTTLRPALRNSRCSKKARKRSRKHLR